MAGEADAGTAIGDLTTEQPDSTDPDYLAWKRKQIMEAIEHADRFPDNVLSEEEVWKKHGLDY